MKLCVSSVESTVQNGTMPVIHIFGRDEYLRPHHIQIINYRPYFWCSEDTVKNLPDSSSIEVSSETGISIRKVPLRKIYTQTPYDIKKYAAMVEDFESDIAYHIKFMVDLGIKTGIVVPDVNKQYYDVAEVRACDFETPLRMWMIDIECSDENGFPRPERDPITCITLYDNFTEKYSTYYLMPNAKPQVFPPPMENGCFDKDKHIIKMFPTEKEMMNVFVKDLQEADPDVLSGWNFKDFDIDYIIRRLDTLKLDPQRLGRIYGKIDKMGIKGRTIFDLLEGYKKMHPTKLESYRLDFVGEVELGENKVRYTGTLGDLWQNDVAKMIEYNYKDVQLCVGIDAKSSLIQFFIEISRYIGCPLGNTLHSSQVVDIYVLNTAKGKYVLPTRGSAEAGDMFQGATVFVPNKGLKKNIGVVDLKALYPMSMITCNASLETKVVDPSIPDSMCNIAPTGTRFLKEPDGLTRTIINTLLEERDSKKALRNTFEYGSPEYEKYDMQQNVVKVIMNTYYGVSGFAKFRLYDRDIGAAVTSIGRATIAHTKKFIAEKGYEVIYGDTDSCFIQMPEEMTAEEIVEAGTTLAKQLNESYPEYAKRELNSETSFFSIKFEKLYGRFFQGDAKKRYAGVILWKEGVWVKDGEGKLDIAGFELKRSDSSKITQQVQETVFNMILDGKEKADLQAYVKPIIADFRSGRLPLEEIGVPNALSRDIEEYAGERMQVRAAKYSNDNLGTHFRSGSKPKRVYLKKVNTAKYPPTDVLAFEYPEDVNWDDFEIDYILMCEKGIQKPLERIFDALGWRWEEFDPAMKPVMTLDEWF